MKKSGGASKKGTDLDRFILVREDPIREVTYQIVKCGQPCHKVVTYYLIRAEAGTLRPDKREGIAQIRWFPVPHVLDRIHRERVREIAHHASTLLQHAMSAQ